MRAPTLQLLCDPNPMCYGATAALLSVLDYVKGHRVAMGTGVSGELLSRDPAVDEWLDVDVKDESDVADVVRRRHLDAVLVVSNTANLAMYAAVGVPVFFVDILYWLGPNKGPDRGKLLEAEFAQNFPGVRELTSAAGTEVQVIGPLVRAPRGSRPRAGTLAQLGGAASRWVVPGRNSSFPTMAAEWIHAALDSLPGPLHLALGGAAAAQLEQKRTAPRFSAGPLAQGDFLERLASSRLYLTTPGLGGVFEGLLAGTPTLFLPPQNASQVLQLAVYEEEGLVAPGLNLRELDPAFPRVPKALGERELTSEVLASLRRVEGKATTDRVASHLRRQLDELPMRAWARERFLAELGPPGGEQVARAIGRFWGERWM